MKMLKKVVMIVGLLAVLAGFAPIASASTPIMGRTAIRSVDYVESDPIMGYPVSIFSFGYFAYLFGF
jgi:hypothetical protein